MRILIVDDHPIMRGGVRVCLQDFDSAIDVVEAANLLDAVRIAKAPPPVDVVLLDLLMPGSAGIGYVRTNPRFHAPQGKYDWLNKTMFVGTISPSPEGGAVIIRAFKVL